MKKFMVPEVLMEDVYTQSMANCCTRLNQNLCGITYRTNS